MSIYQLERAEDANELGELLRESDSVAVRARAAEALGGLDQGEESIVEGLIRSAVDDPEDAVRAAAVDALDALGDRALERLISRMADYEIDRDAGLPVEAFVDALHNEVAELRMAAANAIGRKEFEAAAPALVRRLDDDDPRVRLRVVRAVGHVGDERAVRPLAGLVGDSDARTRVAIAVALGEIGTAGAFARLAPLLDDDELDVRVAAVRSLGTFDDSRPIGRLIERLEDDEMEVRRAAVYAVVELLSNAPAERSHGMRTEIVDALSTTHADVVTTALVDLFEESTEAHQRRNATWLLGRVTDGGAVAIETLVTALDDDDEMVRRFAATSLAQLDSPEVEESLLDALDTTFGEGRSMILFTLGTVGTEAARERLVRLLDEVDDPDTQERTIAALSRLGGA